MRESCLSACLHRVCRLVLWLGNSQSVCLYSYGTHSYHIRCTSYEVLISKFCYFLASCFDRRGVREGWGVVAPEPATLSTVVTPRILLYCTYQAGKYFRWSVVFCFYSQPHRYRNLIILLMSGKYLARL